MDRLFVRDSLTPVNPARSAIFWTATPPNTDEALVQRERLEGLGAVIVPPVRATHEYLAQFVRSEIEKWTGPIKASGVTVE